MHDNNKGQLAILACALLWSTSGLFIKLLPWNPVLIAGGRSFFTAFFLLAVRLFSDSGRLRFSFNLGAAAVCYALTLLFFVIANKLTSSAAAIMLQYGAPIWAGLVGWFVLGVAPKKIQWLSIAVMAAGLFVFFRGGLSEGKLIGDIVALLSGMVFGAHSVFLRKMKDENPVDALIIAHILCAAVALPFFLAAPPELNRGSIMAILFMGFIQLGCAGLFFAYGIKRVSPVTAMLTSAIEPVLNPVWVFAFMGEIPSPNAIVGGLIIIGAILINGCFGVDKLREVR